MNAENEFNRLTKENETFRKIIKTQQNTIIRLVDYFILQKTQEPFHADSKNAPR